MKIPRQFYGVNYIAKLYDSFQDSALTECPKLSYHGLDKVLEIPLVKRNTYSLGLSAARLSCLLRKLSSNRYCALDGIAAARGENMVFTGYRPPYTEEIPRMTNSTCKTVIAIGIMFAVSEGLFKVSDTVLSFFPEYETLLTPKYLRQVTVEHLLTMTSGSKCNEIAAMAEEDWVKAFLLTDCQFTPGSRFIYNSMNTYMLAAVLVKTTGKSVMEYLKSRFFEPLGVNHIKWELCPKGIERGGWGLHISLEGMLKIGIFLANDGRFGGKQLLPPSFIRKMKSVKVEQDVDGLATGYGYQLWHLPEGFYMLSGMYGQHVIIDETHHFVVAVNAHSDKMFPDSPLVRIILDCMMDESLYTPQKWATEAISCHCLMKEMDAFCRGWHLSEKKKHIFLYAAKRKRAEMQNTEKIQKLLTVFDNKRLHADQAGIKLFPYMMQIMYQYPPFSITDIALKKQKDYLKIYFYRAKEKKDSPREHLVLEAGIGIYRYQVITVGQNKEQIAVKVYVSTDEDGHKVMMLDIVFLAQGFIRRIKFFLLESRIGIESQEYPDVRSIMDQLLYGETILGGNAIDLTNKLPESIQLFLGHKVEPRVTASWDRQQ